MEIQISNSQKDVPVKVSALKKMARQVLESQAVDPSAELSISLVSKRRIQELNHQFRKIDAPTDVLAFALESVESSPRGAGEPLMLGDVVIAPAVALEQTREYHTALDEEMKLLLIHGILHLLGHDHEEAAEAEKMWAEENRIMSLFRGEDK